MASNERMQTPASSNASYSRLLRAREMIGYAFSEHRVDVRGWRVYSSDAEHVGSVHALFVDIRTKAVRYLGVSVVNRHTGRPTGSVLVPIGAATRAGDRPVVVLSFLSLAQLAAAPRLPNRAITRADEEATLTAYGIVPTAGSPSGDLYGSPVFAEQPLFGCAAPHRHG